MTSAVATSSLRSNRKYPAYANLLSSRIFKNCKNYGSLYGVLVPIAPLWGVGCLVFKLYRSSATFCLHDFTWCSKIINLFIAVAILFLYLYSLPFARSLTLVIMKTSSTYLQH